MRHRYQLEGVFFFFFFFNFLGHPLVHVIFLGKRAKSFVPAISWPIEFQVGPGIGTRISLPCTHAQWHVCANKATTEVRHFCLKRRIDKIERDTLTGFKEALRPFSVERPKAHSGTFPGDSVWNWGAIFGLLVA